MSRPDDDAPRWAGPVLWAAAIYNVAFGVFAGLFPLTYWEWIGIDPPLYPTLWQCIGMIVACYGVGYAFAARAPFTLWPIVLVGMLGKLLGPAGFVWAVSQGQLPIQYGWILLSNDLVWWVPFAILCWQGARRDVYFLRADAWPGAVDSRCAPGKKEAPCRFPRSRSTASDGSDERSRGSRSSAATSTWSP